MSADGFARIDVLTVDWHGNLLGKWVPASQRQNVLDGKVSLPQSTQAQDIRGEDRDQLIGLSLSVGDPEDVCVPTGTQTEIQPWNTSAEQILTTMHDLNGKPIKFDCRALLAAMIERFTDHAWHPVVAVELEFHLLDASTRKSGKPAIPAQLSIAGDAAKRLLHAVAGLVDTLEELQLIFAPNGNSHRRLQPYNFAPVRQDRGYDHRGVAVRLPETHGAAARVEHRVAHTLNRRVSDIELETFLSRV